MKIEKETKNTYLDYKTIRELSHRMDCTITEADFCTSYPNPYRIGYIVSDINRYLKHRNKYSKGDN